MSHTESIIKFRQPVGFRTGGQSTFEKSMIRVTEVEQTCIACPTQWEGMTADGRRIYARYRWGRLSVRIGEPGDTHEFAAVRGEEILRVQLGDRYKYGGDLSFEELREVTRELIGWPEQAAISPEAF